MPSPIKKGRRYSRVMLGAIGVVVFCASGAAAIIEWVPHTDGIPADILFLRGTEHSASHADAAVP